MHLFLSGVAIFWSYGFIITEQDYLHPNAASNISALSSSSLSSFSPTPVFKWILPLRIWRIILHGNPSCYIQERNPFIQQHILPIGHWKRGFAIYVKASWAAHGPFLVDKKRRIQTRKKFRKENGNEQWNKDKWENEAEEWFSKPAGEIVKAPK